MTRLLLTTNHVISRNVTNSHHSLQYSIDLRIGHLIQELLLFLIFEQLESFFINSLKVFLARKNKHEFECDLFFFIWIFALTLFVKYNDHSDEKQGPKKTPKVIFYFHEENKTQLFNIIVLIIYTFRSIEHHIIVD